MTPPNPPRRKLKSTRAPPEAWGLWNPRIAKAPNRSYRDYLAPWAGGINPAVGDVPRNSRALPIWADWMGPNPLHRRGNSYNDDVARPLYESALRPYSGAMRKGIRGDRPNSKSAPDHMRAARSAPFFGLNRRHFPNLRRWR